MVLESETKHGWVKYRASHGASSSLSPSENPVSLLLGTVINSWFPPSCRALWESVVEELNYCQTVTRVGNKSPTSFQLSYLPPASPSGPCDQGPEITKVHECISSSFRAQSRGEGGSGRAGTCRRTNEAQAKEKPGNTEGTAEAANSELVTCSQGSLSSLFLVRVWM